MKKFEMPEIQVIDFGEDIMIEYMSGNTYIDQVEGGFSTEGDVPHTGLF